MKSITAAELKGWQQTVKEYVLLDVREEWEHTDYNIGGINIPLGELMANKNLLDTNKTIVVYCEKGIRSAIAIQRLEAYGFANMLNLEGGMYAWRKMEG